MTTIIVLFLIAAFLFFLAFYMRLKGSDPSKPTPARVWAAITGAVGAIGAAIATIFSSGQP